MSNLASSSNTRQFLLIIIFILFSFFISISYSDSRIQEASLNCSTAKYPPALTNTLITTFTAVMEGLLGQVTNQNWGSYHQGNNPPIYALANCMKDLSNTECLLCFAESRTRLPRCIPSVSGRVYLDGCFLRYDNYSFFGEAVDKKHDKAVCGKPFASIVKQDYSKLEFTQSVIQLIHNVTRIAIENDGFGVSDIKSGLATVYSMAQCWKPLSSHKCKECLDEAAHEIRNCTPSIEGRSLNAGCYLRYSTTKFYSTVAENMNDTGFSHIGVTVAIALAASAFSLLCLFGACLGYKRLEVLRIERNNLGRLSSAVSKSNLNFKYETLEKATEFFDPSRKLGQGGAGSVFRGTLPDGRIVAVKRLFFNTRQWVDEFFNEVNLISGIRHKNLVQLLGCSIEGPESLLVYEYVANKSLDQVIFDKNATQTLTWQQRFDIVVGTAEGLAYLHGGTQTRIIHRDIKCSNILLDENLTAKIADFGLARCFAADKTHLSTGIAGTLGYMAPEYLVRGQLTEKADVYSFGVLVLEIICGKKNNVFMQESGSILQKVYKHYKGNTLTNSVDPSLEGNFPEKEASDVLQVGLLCTQASVALRPSMSDVVKMLTDKDFPVPLPKQPPFLNASVMDPDASPISFGMSSKSSTLTNSTSFKSSSSSSAFALHDPASMGTSTSQWRKI
ncbi:hypothetical protein C5167_042225 [Papaver somniferum]|uniref:Protein kinase domain-containing protein n=2 Tax=Papaver somniferum TaxID=3469 RepID=A0A4Y7L4U5_PAPSO|nr:cysteine-rich receptor-like protein kinase 42 isoform X1 [Papaver somniferum]RZC79652.1 hypothetical protein C5167_042225 [Papaver somniferum]